MYVDIPFWRFFLGMMIVAIPVAVMEHSGERRAASAYLVLILVATLVANWRGVEAFSGFVKRELGGTNERVG